MGPWYLDTTCSKYMTNEKKLFIGKLQPNVTKLEYANKKFLIFARITSVYLSCMNENKNPLTTYIYDILYLSQTYFISNYLVSKVKKS